MQKISSRLSSVSPEVIFTLVGHFPPRLSLDVGAAMGTVAKQVQAACPEGRTICFEPWDGNMPYYQDMVGDVSNTTLIKKAVSDFNGPGVFFVPSVVKGDEAQWGNRPGYSSTGMLIPEAEAADKPGEKIFAVDVCSLDSCVSEPVRFLKIDVQGGEGAVLRGAKNLIENNFVDMILVEFQGEEEVVNFVQTSGFSAYDIEYNAIPVGVDASELGFKAGAKPLPLSNGSTALRGRVEGIPRTMEDLGHFMREWRPQKGYIWTDMLLVRPDFVDELNAILDTLGYLEPADP